MRNTNEFAGLEHKVHIRRIIGNKIVRHEGESADNF